MASSRWSSFNLLYSDGVVRVLFEGMLTPEQYGELRQVVESAANRNELANSARQLATKWNVSLVVDFDPV